MVIVDCSQINGREREDLFMPSRDRLAEAAVSDSMDKALVQVLSTHEGLRELADKRREEDMQKAFTDNKPLEEMLNKLLKSSPDLESIFAQGQELLKESGFKYVKIQKEYVQRRFPTFFRLKDGVKEFVCKIPINSYSVTKYETDAGNDYFLWTSPRGVFRMLERNGKPIEDIVKSKKLWNGIYSLQLKPPRRANIGDVFRIDTIVKDMKREFSSRLKIRIVKPVAKIQKPGPKVPPVPPPPPPPGGRAKREISGGAGHHSQLQMPTVRWIKRGDELWERYGFTERTALKLIPNGITSFDIYFSEDNMFLKNQIMVNKNLHPNVIKKQYELGLVLACIGMYHNLKNMSKNEQLQYLPVNEENIKDVVGMVCQGLAQVIYPITSISTIRALSVTH
jgi:hypothetical protein